MCFAKCLSLATSYQGNSLLPAATLYLSVAPFPTVSVLHIGHTTVLERFIAIICLVEVYLPN